MHKLLTGLCVALLSIQSVAMDKDHHKSHHHQSNSFVTVEVEGIVLSNFRARASIGQMKNSGAYGEIQSNTYDRLIRASSSVAAVVELHEHINDDGIMRMREVEGGARSKGKSVNDHEARRISHYAHQPPQTPKGG